MGRGRGAARPQVEWADSASASESREREGCRRVGYALPALQKRAGCGLGGGGVCPAPAGEAWRPSEAGHPHGEAGPRPGAGYAAHDAPLLAGCPRQPTAGEAVGGTLAPRLWEQVRVMQNPKETMSHLFALSLFY